VTDLPQLLMFGRNFFDENNHEYFMICWPLTDGITGNYMLKAMNDSITSEDILWSNCVNICTDEATALTAHKKSFHVK
jgi:hypothetical protein